MKALERLSGDAGYAVLTYRHGALPQRKIGAKLSIIVREERPVARRFVAQARAERFGIERDKQQPVLVGEMTRGGAFDLIRERQMDETVPRVVGRTFVNADAAGRAPVLRGYDFVNRV